MPFEAFSFESAIVLTVDPVTGQLAIFLAMPKWSSLFLVALDICRMRYRQTYRKKVILPAKQLVV